MDEQTGSIISLVMSWILPTLIAISGGYAWLRTIRNRDAEAEKLEVETDGLASDQWKALYKEMSLRCEKSEARISIMEQEIKEEMARLTLQLEAANDYVEYLIIGINTLIDQLINTGVEPEFRPTKQFRGGDTPIGED